MSSYLKKIIIKEVENQLGNPPKMGDIHPTDEKDRPGMENRPKDGMAIKQHKNMMWLNESADKAFIPAVKDFCQYAIKKWKINQPVTIKLREDAENAKNILGYTGHYSPEKKEIVVFITGRGYKDIIKSIGHELVHHLQNCRGDFNKDLKLQEGYAQTNPHLRKMEEEAYLLSAITFRDWEDEIKDNKQEELDEFSAVGGGGVVGYTGPLGMETSTAHDIMWSGDKKKKSKK